MPDGITMKNQPSQHTPWTDTATAAAVGIGAGIALIHAIWAIIVSPILAVIWLTMTIYAYRKSSPATRKKGWWTRCFGSTIATLLGTITILVVFGLYSGLSPEQGFAVAGSHAIIPLLVVALLEKRNRKRNTPRH